MEKPENKFAIKGGKTEKNRIFRTYFILKAIEKK